MSHHDYVASLAVDMMDLPFYGVIMAAMRKADSTNAVKLTFLFPEVSAELQSRYDAPSGWLPDDPDLPESMKAWYASQGT